MTNYLYRVRAWIAGHHMISGYYVTPGAIKKAAEAIQRQADTDVLIEVSTPGQTGEDYVILLKDFC